MSDSLTIATAVGDVTIFDHEFKPYPSTANASLIGVCCECGDYHDARRERLQTLADKVSTAYETKEQAKRGAPGRQAGGRVVMSKDYPDAEALAPSSTDPDAFEPTQFRAGDASVADVIGLTGNGFLSGKMYDHARALRDPSDAQSMADAFGSFTTAARALKAAELAFRDAQQVYAEAVKRLSEEAVK